MGGLDGGDGGGGFGGATRRHVDCAVGGVEDFGQLVPHACVAAGYDEDLVGGLIGVR